ncbi:MAG: hypothetical protein HKL79_05280 [Thermoplasmata archaeon]|nr:hypothetical protein [Thermoplasmata archaeon]
MARDAWPPARAPPPRDDREDVAERRARAFEEPLDIRRRPGSYYPLLDVRNPMHDTHYLVLLPEYPDRSSAMCTCADFARRGLGTCKHVEAGLRWLRFHPKEAVRGPEGPQRSDPIWREIDRRLRAEATDPAPIALRLRAPGAVLFERGPSEALPATGK